jgi:IS30 family transposase
MKKGLPMKYRHLNTEERYAVEKMSQGGCSNKMIAKTGRERLWFF